MTYEMKEINESDCAQILKKSEGISWLYQWLGSAQDQNIFPRHIAKDSSSDDFLMTLPAMAGVDPERSNFLICWRGQFFLLGLMGWTNVVVIEGSRKMDSQDLLMLQEAISSAFFVYGRFGTGAFTRDGKPNLRVFPEFILG